MKRCVTFACALALAVGSVRGASAAKEDEWDRPWRPAHYHCLFSEQERQKPYVFAESHDLHDWPFLDGQWEGILADTDGFVWFAVSSHSFDHSAQLFRYDPGRDKVEHVADIDQVCGEKLSGHAPQDKIHCTMWQDGDVIYFLSITALCLVMSFRALESRKWS